MLSQGMQELDRKGHGHVNILNRQEQGGLDGRERLPRFQGSKVPPMWRKLA